MAINTILWERFITWHNWWKIIYVIITTHIMSFQMILLSWWIFIWISTKSSQTAASYKVFFKLASRWNSNCWQTLPLFGKHSFIIYVCVHNIFTMILWLNLILINRFGCIQKSSCGLIHIVIIFLILKINLIILKILTFS